MPYVVSGAPQLLDVLCPDPGAVARGVDLVSGLNQYRSAT